MRLSLLLIAAILTTAMTNGQNIAAFFERLPLLPSNAMQAGQFSSYNPRQQNGDSEHYLYRDANGDAVIFDQTGPGCLTSMWGTVLDPEGLFKFYFDGEETARYTISVIDLYKGVYPQFPQPYTSYDRRGYYLEDSYAGNSFFPLPFGKSLRISMQGKPTFYHILYEKYPYEASNPLFDNNESRMEYLNEALEGKDYVVAGLQTMNNTDNLEPHKSFELLNVDTSGTVRYIEIETDAKKELLQDLYLMMIWDEERKETEPAQDRLAYEQNDNSRLYNVNAPLGFFFGTPYNPIELNTLPLSVRLIDGRMRLSCRFAMPFLRNAKILIFNKSDKTAGKITSRVITGENSYPSDRFGYFTTFFRKGQTEYGRDWIFAETPGTGWFLGVIQSCRMEHYCEGNEHFYFDGNRTPAINGTGTEDYYLGCFWPNKVYHTPFAGCVNDVRIEGGGDPNRYLVCLPTDYSTPAVYYRFHLEMPLPFYSSLDARIQHGGESQIESEYASLAFLYLKRQPSLIQTDFIDLGNAVSRETHQYKTLSTLSPQQLKARYEGDYLYTQISDAGFYHPKGETITFHVATDGDNCGVRLRRRSDRSIGRQKADVYVDGRYAGCWYDAASNLYLRWHDSEFNIPYKLTQGKESISIKLVINEGQFTDFEYIILSYTK
jgi:hypothetical protein